MSFFRKLTSKKDRKKKILLKELISKYRDIYLMDVYFQGFTAQSLYLREIPLFLNITPHQQYERIGDFLTKVLLRNTEDMKSTLLDKAIYLGFFKILEVLIWGEISSDEGKSKREFKKKNEKNREYLFNADDLKNPHPNPQEMIEKQKIFYQRMKKSFEPLNDGIKVVQTRMKEIMKEQRNLPKKFNNKMLIQELRAMYDSRTIKPSKITTHTQLKKIFRSKWEKYTPKEDFVDNYQVRKQVVDVLEEIYPRRKISETLPYCNDIDIWRIIIDIWRILPILDFIFEKYK